MVGRIGRRADWGRGVEQLHVDGLVGLRADWGRGVEQLHVDGLVGLAIAVTAAVVDAFEGSIVIYKQTPKVVRLGSLLVVLFVDFPIVLDQR